MVADREHDIIVAAYPEGKPPLKTITLLALTGVLAISAARAVEVPSLYTARVPYDAAEPDARATAYDMALAQVVLRVSDSELVNDVVLFDELFPDPAAYVMQFRPGPDNTLFVTFDGDAIEAALKRAGQRVWGGDRPLTLVWLAVDWGQDKRDILGSADPQIDPAESRSMHRDLMLRERLLEVANRRGLPVVFPLLDGEDLAAVSASDIWGGFDERVLEASRRYDVNSILIGRLHASGRSSNRWTYYFGPDPREWSGTPETVLARVADLLAAELAIGGADPLRTVQLGVSGITTVEALGRVHRILAGTSLIEDFTIFEVAADRVGFRVNAHGGAVRLAQALRFAGLIENERIDMGDFGIDERMGTLEFFFNP